MKELSLNFSIKELAGIIQEKVGFNGELYFNMNKLDGIMSKLTNPMKLKTLG